MGSAGSLWAEYKYIKKLPVRDTTRLRTSLSEQQRLWLKRLVDFKHQAVLIIGVEDTAVILREHWHQDITKADYLKRSIPRRDVARWIEEVCLPRRGSGYPSRKPKEDLEPEEK